LDNDWDYDKLEKLYEEHGKDDFVEHLDKLGVISKQRTKIVAIACYFEAKRNKKENGLEQEATEEVPETGSTSTNGNGKKHKKKTLS